MKTKMFLLAMFAAFALSSTYAGERHTTTYNPSVRDQFIKALQGIELTESDQVVNIVFQVDENNMITIKSAQSDYKALAKYLEKYLNKASLKATDLQAGEYNITVLFVDDSESDANLLSSR